MYEEHEPCILAWMGERVSLWLYEYLRLKLEIHVHTKLNNIIHYIMIFNAMTSKIYLNESSRVMQFMALSNVLHLALHSNGTIHKIGSLMQYYNFNPSPLSEITEM